MFGLALASVVEVARLPCPPLPWKLESWEYLRRWLALEARWDCCANSIVDGTVVEAQQRMMHHMSQRLLRRTSTQHYRSRAFAMKIWIWNSTTTISCFFAPDEQLKSLWRCRGRGRGACTSSAEPRSKSKPAANSSEDNASSDAGSLSYSNANKESEESFKYSITVWCKTVPIDLFKNCFWGLFRVLESFL